MLSDRIEYWVGIKWPHEKQFKDTRDVTTPEDAIALRDIESRRYPQAEHRAIKRTITEEIL